MCFRFVLKNDENDLTVKGSCFVDDKVFYGDINLQINRSFGGSHFKNFNGNHSAESSYHVSRTSGAFTMVKHMPKSVLSLN